MATVWVSRVSGAGSAINGVYANQQPGLADEALDSGDSGVLAYLAPAKKARSMYAIAANVFALTSVQKANVIADLFGGTPPKYQQDLGPNAAAISAIYASLTNAAGVAVFNQVQQLIIVAMYTQGNPTYLVTPSFDPTINIAGSQ